jgi:hypothetical protein
MRLIVWSWLLFTSLAAPAAAQIPSRWYLTSTIGSNWVTADGIDTSSIGTLGAGLGIRLTPRFGVEVGLDRGFGRLSRSYEGFGWSVAPPGSTREEIDRLAVYQRFDHDWTPGAGFSALAVWREQAPRRVTAAAFAGVSGRWYRERFQTTTLRIPPNVDPSPRFQPTSETFTRNRGGLVAGLMVPVAMTKDLRVAPEIKYIYGSFGDEIYHVFATGVRVLWKF